MTLAESITRAKGGDWYGHQGLIPGPGHSAADRSMRISDKGADDVLLHSFAGDDWKALKDQWRADGTLPPRDQAMASIAATATTPYVYRDAAGTPVFRMVRTVRASGKSFHAEHQDARGGWTKGMGGATPLPYRLPELIAAHPDEQIYIVEGEKDADNLAAVGLVATTNPNGAGKWRADYAAHLSGRECIILPDNDDPGRAHGADVVEKLRGAGIACVVVELPGLREKGDVSDWLAAGGTSLQLAALVAAAWDAPAGVAASTVDASPDRPSSHGLPMEWFRDLKPQLDGMWLIKKLLPSTGLALIYGHPGSGKSFLALDFAFHVALGWPWCGRKVRAGLVVYVGAEGTAGLRNRMVAFRQHHDIDAARNVPLVLIPTPIDLQGIDADTPRLMLAIREAVSASGAPPALIIVDTLSKTFGGGKEVTDDMAGYVANCQRIASEFGCCVIPVHHRPKDAESEEPRGHGSLKGGVDTVLLVEAGKPKRVRVTKQKDADVGDAIGFNLIPVTLGVDEDGETVTSCVVELTDGVPFTTPSGKRLSPAQANAVAALERAIDEHGVDAPAGIPLAMLKFGLVSRVAAVRDWRAAVYATDSDPDKKPDTMLKTFNRAVASLQAADLAQVWEGVAWPTLR